MRLICYNPRSVIPSILFKCAFSGVGEGERYSTCIMFCLFLLFNVKMRDLKIIKAHHQLSRLRGK